jgi:DNA polymerase-3 subunit epsilon
MPCCHRRKNTNRTYWVTKNYLDIPQRSTARIYACDKFNRLYIFPIKTGAEKMTREIVLDTETTGLDPNKGDRVVEIGCVELMGGIRTGAVFHCYLNPERDVPDEAFRVHGLSTAFLADKPIFSEKVDDFLGFIADSPLIIHNAAFDMRFVNFELERLGFSALPMARAVDTVLIARKKFAGSPASLDALCKRFNIDLSGRDKHGALLDAELLAEVYLELMGGRQAMLLLDPQNTTKTGSIEIKLTRKFREAREFIVSEAELSAHSAMVAKLKNAIWAEAS